MTTMKKSAPVRSCHATMGGHQVWAAFLAMRGCSVAARKHCAHSRGVQETFLNRLLRVHKLLRVQPCHTQPRSVRACVRAPGAKIVPASALAKMMLVDARITFAVRSRCTSRCDRRSSAPNCRIQLAAYFARGFRSSLCTPPRLFPALAPMAHPRRAGRAASASARSAPWAFPRASWLVPMAFPQFLSSPASLFVPARSACRQLRDVLPLLSCD